MAAPSEIDMPDELKMELSPRNKLTVAEGNGPAIFSTDYGRRKKRASYSHQPRQIRSDKREAIECMAARLQDRCPEDCTILNPNVNHLLLEDPIAFFFDGYDTFFYGWAFLYEVLAHIAKCNYSNSIARAGSVKAFSRHWIEGNPAIFRNITLETKWFDLFGPNDQKLGRSFLVDALVEILRFKKKHESRKSASRATPIAPTTEPVPPTHRSTSVPEDEIQGRKAGIAPRRHSDSQIPKSFVPIHELPKPLEPKMQIIEGTMCLEASHQKQPSYQNHPLYPSYGHMMNDASNLAPLPVDGYLPGTAFPPPFSHQFPIPSERHPPPRLIKNAHPQRLLSHGSGGFHDSLDYGHGSLNYHKLRGRGLVPPYSEHTGVEYSSGRGYSRRIYPNPPKMSTDDARYAPKPPIREAREDQERGRRYSGQAFGQTRRTSDRGSFSQTLPHAQASIDENNKMSFNNTRFVSNPYAAKNLVSPLKHGSRQHRRPSKSIGAADEQHSQKTANATDRSAKAITTSTHHGDKTIVSSLPSTPSKGHQKSDGPMIHVARLPNSPNVREELKAIVEPLEGFIRIVHVWPYEEQDPFRLMALVAFETEENVLKALTVMKKTQYYQSHQLRAQQSKSSPRKRLNEHTSPSKYIPPRSCSLPRRPIVGVGELKSKTDHVGKADEKAGKEAGETPVEPPSKIPTVLPSSLQERAQPLKSTNEADILLKDSNPASVESKLGTSEEFSNGVPKVRLPQADSSSDFPPLQSISTPPATTTHLSEPCLSQSSSRTKSFAQIAAENSKAPKRSTSRGSQTEKKSSSSPGNSSITSPPNVSNTDVIKPSIKLESDQKSSRTGQHRESSEPMGGQLVKLSERVPQKNDPGTVSNGPATSTLAKSTSAKILPRNQDRGAPNVNQNGTKATHVSWPSDHVQNNGPKGSLPVVSEREHAVGSRYNFLTEIELEDAPGAYVSHSVPLSDVGQGDAEEPRETKNSVEAKLPTALPVQTHKKKKSKRSTPTRLSGSGNQKSQSATEQELPSESIQDIPVVEETRQYPRLTVRPHPNIKNESIYGEIAKDKQNDIVTHLNPASNSRSVRPEVEQKLPESKPLEWTSYDEEDSDGKDYAFQQPMAVPHLPQQIPLARRIANHEDWHQILSKQTETKASTEAAKTLTYVLPRAPTDSRPPDRFDPQNSGISSTSPFQGESSKSSEKKAFQSHIKEALTMLLQLHAMSLSIDSDTPTIQKAQEARDESPFKSLGLIAESCHLKQVLAWKVKHAMFIKERPSETIYHDEMNSFLCNELENFAKQLRKLEWPYVEADLLGVHQDPSCRSSLKVARDIGGSLQELHSCCTDVNTNRDKIDELMKRHVNAQVFWYTLKYRDQRTDDGELPESLREHPNYNSVRGSELISSNLGIADTKDFPLTEPLSLGLPSNPEEDSAFRDRHAENVYKITSIIHNIVCGNKKQPECDEESKTPCYRTSEQDQPGEQQQSSATLSDIPPQSKAKKNKKKKSRKKSSTPETLDVKAQNDKEPSKPVSASRQLRESVERIELIAGKEVKAAENGTGFTSKEAPSQVENQPPNLVNRSRGAGQKTVWDIPSNEKPWGKKKSGQ